MKFLQLLSQFLAFKNRTPKRVSVDYKQEQLVKQGRDQFKRLLDKGLSVPIALL